MFVIKISKYQCHLNILKLFVLIVGCGFLLSLSYWQYTRGHTKETTISQLADGQKTAPQEIHTADNITTEHLHNRLKVYCKLDGSRTLFWDNQHFEGRFGYDVIEPCQFKDGSVIMINRGFIALPTPHKRYEFPKLEPILPNKAAADEGIVGSIDNFPVNKLISKSFEKETKDWPKLIQNLNPTDIAKVLEMPINPMLLQVQANSPYAYIKQDLKPWLSPQKHYGYALQWLLLAMAYTVIFILGNLQRNPKHEQI